MLPKDRLVEVVTEDLAYIRDDWNEQIEDAALRRGSVVLRRLLVDGELQRAWKAAGFEKEPTVRAATLDSVTGGVPLARFKFASAGGARFRGAEIRGATTTLFAMPPTRECLREAGPPLAELGLRRFTEAPVIVIDGKEIVRRVLVKFIANKLGGAHYDTSRKHDAEATLFRRLDRVMDQVKLLGKPAIYFELLAVGQQLAQSEDISRFLEKTGAGGTA
jgi:uncharacterized protein (DUF2164 family)